MCGTSAVIALEAFDLSKLRDPNYREELSSNLDRSLELIKHRGPDDRGQWISSDNRVALGHARLTINDLSTAGRQPFVDDKNGIYAVVNGEFYDYQPLHDELSQGYEFQSTSDSEIVIALYLKYGNHFLSKLRGEFSVVLYDARRQYLVAARDRYGIKPLFWTIDDNRLLIASEIKAFLPLGWKAKWDIRSLLEDGWLYDERTLFKGVRKILPGHYMTCSSFEYFQMRSYWDANYPDKRTLETRTEEEMIIGLRERLLNSVRLRMKADVPVGIYLSGGIDSAVCAGMAAELHKERMNGFPNGTQLQAPVCFGIGFEEEEAEKNMYDETDIARRTAEWLGLEFHTIKMTDKSLAENFADAVFKLENQQLDLNFVGKYVLSSLPGQHSFKVVLTGEGSDEHFAGYPNFHPDLFREPDRSWPPAGMSESEREENRIIASRVSMGQYKNMDRDFVVSPSPESIRMLNNTELSRQRWPFSLNYYAPWTQQAFGAGLNKGTARANAADGRALSLINERWHPLHAAFYIWNKTVLPNILLTALGDRMEMAHSIEGRPPFLDHELTDYINHLPPSLKARLDFRDGKITEKWILREASKPYITDELYKRTKHPFTAPSQYPKDGHVHNVFKKYLTRENIENLGFVETDKVLEAFERAFAEPQDTNAIRLCSVTAQWVVLSQRFNVEKATPPFGGSTASIIQP